MLNFIINQFTYPKTIADYLKYFGLEKQPKAKVLSVDRSVENSLSIALEVDDKNWDWKLYRPGQYVMLTVPVEGRFQTRCFSISEVNQANNEIKLGIRINQKGTVTRFLSERLKAGDQVEVSSAMGEFHVPTGAKSVLLVAGGSGVTPMSAIVQAEMESASDRHIDLLYFSPSAKATMQGAFLDQYTDQSDRFGYHLVYTSEGRPEMTADYMKSIGFELSQYDTIMVCGPSALKRSVYELAEAADLNADLLSENFSILDDAEEANTDLTITFMQNNTQVQNGPGTLLELGENAGVSLQSGCRSGICHMCSCQKVSGTVKNLLTGEISDLPNETIQICVSQALTDVELNQ